MNDETGGSAMTKRQEAIVYYDLCEQARSAGIDTSLDARDAILTVAGLRAAVAAKS